MISDEAKQILVQRWWSEWREIDYSWEALATKPWKGLSVDPDGKILACSEAPEGSRPATLQDYWRDEADHLIYGDGKAWTRIHCPMHFEDGSRGKSEWRADERAILEAIISSKLGASLPVEFDHLQEVKGPDLRAQLNGAVIIKLPLIDQYSEVAPTLVRAVFIEEVNVYGKLGKGSAFQFSLFCANADFRGTIWYGLSSLRESVFLGSCRFDQALFLHGINGEKVSFCGVVSFRRIQVRGQTWMYRCSFHERAEFYRAEFDREVEFAYSTFDYVDFGQSLFPSNARFSGCKFISYAGFQAKFHGTVKFDEAQFLGVAFFDSAQFATYAHFDHAQFRSSATFYNAQFAGAINFCDVNFSHSVTYDRASFGSEISFERTVFKGRVSYDTARFIGKMKFYAAHFESFASFRSIVWPNQAAQWHRCFDQVLFGGITTFAGAGFGRLAAFSGTVFERRVSIDEEDEGRARKTFLDELEAARALAAHDFREGLVLPAVGSPLRRVMEKRRQLHSSKNVRLAELEAGCRVIKKVFASVSDTQRELMLYEYELVARRSQPRTSHLERLLSFSYGFFAGYGGSVIRPLLSLLGTIVIFSAAFLFTSYSLSKKMHSLDGLVQYSSENATEAISFSWSNIFKPLSALSVDDTTSGNSWEQQLILGHGPEARLAVLILSTVQSLSAITFAFLFVLAVRRRFQIN